MPTGGKPRQRFARFCKLALALCDVIRCRHVMGGVGWGGMLTYMSTCHTHAHAAMALDERLRSCLGKDRFHVAEAHGSLRLKKVSGRFLTQNIL